MANWTMYETRYLRCTVKAKDFDEAYEKCQNGDDWEFIDSQTTDSECEGEGCEEE